MVTQYDKFLVAAIMTVLIFVLSSFNIQIPENVQSAITTLLTVALPFAVYLVPNKQPTQPGDTQAGNVSLEEKPRQVEINEKPNRES